MSKYWSWNQWLKVWQPGFVDGMSGPYSIPGVKADYTVGQCSRDSVVYSRPGSECRTYRTVHSDPIPTPLLVPFTRFGRSSFSVTI